MDQVREGLAAAFYDVSQAAPAREPGRKMILLGGPSISVVPGTVDKSLFFRAFLSSSLIHSFISLIKYLSKSLTCLFIWLRQVLVAACGI